MNTKTKLKNILTVPLTISLAVLLTACNQPNSDVPIQSDGDYNDEYQNQYQNTPPLTNTAALAVAAVGVATGYAVGKYTNKTRYSEPNTSYGKPVVVVNKHYYQTNGSRTKYKSVYRKRK